MVTPPLTLPLNRIADWCWKCWLIDTKIFRARKKRNRRRVHEWTICLFWSFADLLSKMPTKWSILRKYSDSEDLWDHTPPVLHYWRGVHFHSSSSDMSLRIKQMLDVDLFSLFQWFSCSTENSNKTQFHGMLGNLSNGVVQVYWISKFQVVYIYPESGCR